MIYPNVNQVKQDRTNLSLLNSEAFKAVRKHIGSVLEVDGDILAGNGHLHQEEAKFTNYDDDNP